MVTNKRSTRQSFVVAVWCLVAVGSFGWIPVSPLHSTQRKVVLHPPTRLFSSRVSDQENALNVFRKVANVPDDEDEMPYPLPTIGEAQIGEMLALLDINASLEEQQALFRYLDEDGDGQISFDEFLPWYDAASQAAQEFAANFQSIILNRRTVDHFDRTPVENDVLRRAVQCAIAAPNRSCSEPWRFIQIGPSTIQKLSQLKTDLDMEEERGQVPLTKPSSWTDIPGWCVVTTRRHDDPIVEQEDFQSTCCAVQNLMLSLWSEGIGSKWTSGPVQRTEEFATICGIDNSVERVTGVIWYGFASGGLVNADPKRRRKSVDDVLSQLP